MDCNWDFNGKSGIVTGAANGIGAALSKLLVASGAGVCLVDRDIAALAEVERDCIATATIPPLSIRADVSREHEILAMVQQAVDHFSRIDFLVTSAGVIYRRAFVDIDVDEWDEVMATNVRGVFLCNQLVVKEMLKRGGGRIVNISSVAGRSISLIGGAHYCSSKHAVIGMTRHMARELCQQGIRANSFCPGATHTAMIHDNMSAREVKDLEQRIALGRLAEADEQARVIAFMLSDAASYLNGACLDSNGGSVML